MINYIESHLHEKLNLEIIGKEAHYSKYHLHRMFAGASGLTIQTYIQRRRLTEAARMLVFSDMPILQIALLAGYESQQSFTDSFRAMYKKAPNQYRKGKEFYPLTLRYVLDETLTGTGGNRWRQDIVFAADQDIPRWMKLVPLVVDGFPRLDETRYLGRLREYIRRRRALILKEKDTAIGVMAFHEKTGSIDFLGVHPQYRKKGVEQAFCEKALYELARPEAITVTTFREGDKADTGYRKMWEELGFAQEEELVEFGYPTQRFVLGKCYKQ